jgi:hypothetical protein
MVDETRWLDRIIGENREFRESVESAALPVERTACSFGVVTCMDPRVNLEAIGIPQFGLKGEGHSSIRIARGIGAMPEARSLVIVIFLAGICEKFRAISG